MARTIKTPDTVDDVVSMMVARKNRKEQNERFPFLIPSGCTLLNLACTHDSRGIAPPGKMIWIVGDSNAGKSVLSTTILAATHYKWPGKYDLYDDDVEQARTFDTGKLFGKDFAAGLLKPEGYGPEPTIEKWYNNLKTCIAHAKKTGRPFIYVTDSWNALSSEADIKATDKIKENGESAGSFNLAKQKKISGLLGRIVNQLADVQSILIVVSQTRDKIGFGSMPGQQSVSGGRSLKFYSSLEIWLAVGETVKEGKDGVGIVTKATVKRSRFTGASATIEFPIFYVYGIDDTQANLDYLMANDVINVPKKAQSMTIPEPIGITCVIRKAAATIEKAGKTKALRKMVVDFWRERQRKLEEKVIGGRKPKFGGECAS